MMYAAGTDMSRLPLIDTMQRNPAYGGNPLPNPYGSPQYSNSQAGGGRPFSPGRAQPTQPQSQGTPYGMPAGGFGNFGNMAPSQRPPAFSTRMTDWMGQQSSPQQYFNQRDAFIQQINNAQGRQSALSGLGNAPPQQMDFGRMYGQAGNMVQQGWRNPFAQDQGDTVWAGGSRSFDEGFRGQGNPSNPSMYQPPTPPSAPYAPPQQPSGRQPNSDLTDYGRARSDWVKQTRADNNNPNGAMQQMIRGMSPSNRSIYQMMANNFSAFR